MKKTFNQLKKETMCFISYLSILMCLSVPYSPENMAFFFIGAIGGVISGMIGFKKEKKFN